MKPMLTHETFEEQRYSTSMLLGTVLTTAGGAAMVAAAITGLVLRITPGFLTSVDIAVIGVAMLALGLSLRTAAPPAA